MILAVRRGRFMALASSQTALWLMTAFSVSLGVLLRSFPKWLSADQVVVKVGAASLMLFFGAQSLYEAAKSAGAKDDKENGAGGTGSSTGISDDPDECEEAECEIQEKLQEDRHWLLEWLEFSLLIFLAEWGDRSMFTTVALAAAQNPILVFIGGCVGHTCAALLAVASGGFFKKYLSEGTMQLAGGILFLVFGVTTLLGVY